MTEIDKAVEWALSVAADSRYGYDQGSRWGPDYDCSSFVISAFENAGVPVKTNGATYTGNMRAVFLKTGFQDVTDTVNRTTGAGLVRGDVLLNEVHHTAIYLGGGQLVEAAGNELGGIRGGMTGDQTGGEIGTRSYYNFSWDCVLRYADGSENNKISSGSYTVAAGDSLWGIASSLLGDGRKYADIMEANGLTGTIIYPGMQLVIPGYEPKNPETPKSYSEAAGETAAVILPVLRVGSSGAEVRALRALLHYQGCSLTEEGNEFGLGSASAVREFQAKLTLEIDGIVGPETWKALITRQM